MYIFGISYPYDLLIIIVITIIGILANLFSKKISEKLNLIDYPSKSVLKIQKKPTPLSGGIAIFFTFVVTLILLVFVRNDFIDSRLIILSALLLFCVVAVGIFDDLGRLSAKMRLLLYIIFASFAVMIFRDHLIFSIAINLFAIFVFAPGIITAINMIDGMDGICASMSIISFVAFLVLSVIAYEDNQILLYFSFAGILSVIPFLFFNFNPAKVFLGSSGSELLGLLFFILVLLSMRNISGYFLPLRILLIGIPVVDLCRVMAIRIRTKKSLMSGDRNHIYDVLSRMGFNQKKVWFIMVVGQTIIVSIALAINYSFVSK